MPGTDAHVHRIPDGAALMTRLLAPAMLCVAVCALSTLSVPAAPTVPTDAEMPGTQPGEVGPYTPPSDCQQCHANTPNPEVEPFSGWQGSMMSHAGRDPLFWAAVAIAEQDFLPNADPALRGGAGDFCLRCHMPGGWLAGRSTPTDGSGLDPATDAEGIECEHCHSIVDPDPPVNVPGTLEQQTAPYIANDGVNGYSGSGMYVIDALDNRLGPYADAVPPMSHPTTLQSPLHRQGEMCGTCHDVSNPVVGDLAHNNGAQQPLDPGTFSGVVGAPVTMKAAFNNPPHKYGIVERTFSEWKSSAFDTLLVNDFITLPADLKVAGGSLEVARGRAWNGTTANYVDGTPRYFTCQTCHMPSSVGKGCRQSFAPVRDDLPEHDLTGAGYWMPEAVIYQDDRGTLRFGSGLTQTQKDNMAAGMVRARAMIQSAASLEATPLPGQLSVRVVNLTAHKLISGYPEGRRVWINIRWLDGQGALVAEDGAYGPIGRTVEDLDGVAHQVESLLDPAGTVAFEAAPGMDQGWAAQLVALGYDPAMSLSFDRMTDQVKETLGDLAIEPASTAYHTFHFALNNVLLGDTRIPPYGFAYDEAKERNALPVPEDQFGDPGPGGAYDYWKLSQFAVPGGAATAEIRLYYQQTSWEYIQFLWLQNDEQNAFLGQEGVNMLDAWLATGMSAPLEMTLQVVDLTGAQGAPGEASRQEEPAKHLRASYDGGSGLIQVSYAAACDSTDTTIYYGPLSAVSSYGYSGAVCNVGATGSASFDPGPGDFFFLAVGNNGIVEGSYGTDTDALERPEDVGTPGCDLMRDLSGTCDP